MSRQTSGRKQTSFIFSPPVLVVIVALMLIGTYVYLTKNKPSADTSSTVSAPTQTKTFRSETMEFEIEVPSGFVVTENLGSVKVKSSVGEILVDRIGTNFSNLTDHLSDPKNNILNKLSNKNDLTINKVSALSGYFEKEKNYFIYINHSVYFLYTADENLYSVLDQIAQSFRYTPK